MDYKVYNPGYNKIASDIHSLYYVLFNKKMPLWQSSVNRAIPIAIFMDNRMWNSRAKNINTVERSEISSGRIFFNIGVSIKENSEIIENKIAGTQIQWIS